MEWLKEFDEVAAATTTKSAGGRIPDGPYRLYIKSAAVNSDDKTVRYQLVLPDCNNREIPKMVFLFSKDGVPQFEWIKSETLAVLPELKERIESGEEQWLLSSLPEYLKQMTGKVVDGRLNTPEGRKYANIYFNGLAANQEVDPTASW